jgi:flagellar basal body-associated protein FliL
MSKVRTITIWMIVLTCLFAIAGIVAAVMYRMGQAKSTARESEVSREEQEQNEGLIDQ